MEGLGKDRAEVLSQLFDSIIGNTFCRYSNGQIKGSIGSVSLSVYPEIVEYLPSILEYIKELEDQVDDYRILG